MGFYQAVENPTLDKNILDLILYSHESLVFDVHNLAPFSTSDHDSVEFKILSPFTQKEEDEKEARDFKKADYQQIEAFLNMVSWPDVFSSCIYFD